MAQEDDSMELKPLEHDDSSLPVSLPVLPPSYEQCVAAVVGPRADYVASPLAVAALFDWDEEDDD
jgi:hypothetical protein